jgi:rubrerythrin
MSEIIEGLNELMKAERAGVETFSELTRVATDPEMRTLFERVRDDEAWSCAGLAECIKQLGGTRTDERGDFAKRVLAVPSLTDRLRSSTAGSAGW